MDGEVQRWLSTNSSQQATGKGKGRTRSGRSIHQVLDCFVSFEKKLFIVVFILGLRWVFADAHLWAFSSCSEQGLSFAAVCGLLIAVASLTAEHRL